MFNDAKSDRVRRFWITSAGVAAVRDLGKGAEQPAWSGTARVVRGSEVVEERSVGLNGGPDSQPCTPRSRFQACSISKLVVSAVVLSLVESGALDLQRPITTWLERSAVQLVGDHAAPPAQQHLRSRALGRHPRSAATADGAAAPEELLALIAAAPLVAPPGAGWRYSGPGFLTAARVVEAVTGQPYATTADALVFTPAGMAATSLRSGSGRPGRRRRPRPRPTLAPAPQLRRHHRLRRPVDHHRRPRPPQPGPARRAAPQARSAAQLWTRHAALPAGEPDGGTDRGDGVRLRHLPRPGPRPQARINPGDMPGYQTLLAHLPDQDLDLAVLCNEEAPSLDAALADLRLP